MARQDHPLAPPGLAVRGLIASVIVTLAGSLLVALPQPVQASEAEIEAVERRVTSLEFQASAAAERHHEAKVRLRRIEKDIATISARLDRNRERIRTLNTTLNAVAVTAWRSGGIDPSLQLLLAENPDAFLSTAAMLDQVARNQNATLRQVSTLRLSLLQDEKELAARRGSATRALAEMSRERAVVDQRLAEAQRVLATLQAEQRRLYEQRQRARAAAAARAAKAARAKAAAAARSGSSSGRTSARVGTVLRYALSQVGDSYRFSATGESSFDCSGLVYSSFRRIGITLPRSSWSQYRATPRISRSQLRPGDLVFFFRRGVAHVGIYIGGSRFVHASTPREGVIISSLNEAWYASRYTGAGRVVR